MLSQEKIIAIVQLFVLVGMMIAVWKCANFQRDKGAEYKYDERWMMVLAKKNESLSNYWIILILILTVFFSFTSLFLDWEFTLKGSDLIFYLVIISSTKIIIEHFVLRYYDKHL